MEDNKELLYIIYCYDCYGSGKTIKEADFNKAVQIAIEEFKNINFQIVRMVSPHQDNDVLYMSKVGY